MSEVIIKGIDSQGRRINSKDFEKMVQDAAAKHNKLILETFGQHNVGGRLKDGEYEIHVKGPCGQRLGCMGRPGTRIICHGSASDDVGYLNIGAEITVLGNATNGVCNAMAEGKVMIAGSIGARGLTMTKWNPDFERPELWVLGSVGDTFAEFNCGGIGVICGVDPMTPNNVLGYRPCVGMVGGWIYYRGNTDQTYSKTNVRAVLPDDEQWQWLMDRMPSFLENIGRMELLDELSDRSQWKMLVSIPPQEVSLIFSGDMPMKVYRRQFWDREFGGDPLKDIAPDLDRSPIGLIETGELRRKRPFWANRPKGALGDSACPAGVPTKERLKLLQEGKTEEAYRLILDHIVLPASVCGHVCPNLCIDDGELNGSSIDIAQLGKHSKDVPPPEVPEPTGEKVAIIGGGPGGMNAAWKLARHGIEAHIFESHDRLGGKLAEIIPRERLPLAIWESEIDRFMKTPNITVHFKSPITKEKFNELKEDYDYIIVAAGSHEPVRHKFPGYERTINALEFLKSAKDDPGFKVGEDVVVIGAGKIGCMVACEAFRLGAKNVTLLEPNKPITSGNDRETAEALGARFLWPVQTKEVTEEGLIDASGKLYPAQTVIVSSGVVPSLDFLPENIEVVRTDNGTWIKTDSSCRTSDSKVFAVGDVEKPGLATNALGRGGTAASTIICEIRHEECDKSTGAGAETAGFTPDLNVTATGKAAGAAAGKCSCRDCHMCEDICPAKAISRIKKEDDGTFLYVSDDDKCIACGFCADICPCGVWVMQPY